MSLPTPYQEHYYIGDGETVEFPFGSDFTALASANVKCIIYFEDGTNCVPTFTVNMEAGSITIVTLTKPDGTVLTVPPLGSVVRVFRETPEQQNVTASQLQNYTAKQLERIFDAIVAMIQEGSYFAKHKTLNLTETQRDVSLEQLGEDQDQGLLYWDAESGTIKSTAYGQDELIEAVERANNVADEAKSIAQQTQGNLTSHVQNLSNPHQTSIEKLTDVSLYDLQAAQFLRFDGHQWKNISSSATVYWGDILGNIADQTDLTTYVSDGLSTKVNIDGTSIMTAPLKFAAGSMRGAVGPYLNGVSFWKMDSQGSLTNIANITDNQFYPVSTNSINLGRSANAWKDLYLGGKAYVATINNGADLSVPNKSGTLATTADVELAARSGRMLTDQGVWYAKMYAATVAPAAENGTSYADFSQVDPDNNPIIVIYERQSGAWVQTETITPPADYDGYVPVTSKIWDIAEQAGQQGGRVLWNHTSQEFTPYPTIISFEDIEVTGTSTVIMPNNPSANQIVNKDYVDNAIGDGTITLTQGGTTKGTFTVNQSGNTTIDLDAGGGTSYHPSLFAHEWDDKLRDDAQWLRADTFSWQAGSTYEAAYKHLRNDMYQWYSWEYNGTTIYTKKRYPEVGDKAYTSSALTTEVGEVTAIDDGFDGIGITVGGNHYDGVTGASVVPTTETIAGVTVNYIPAEDGHKIVTDFHTSEVEAVYAATGVAWYYIIDYGFYRFKLPRTKFAETGLRDTVGKYVAPGLPNITGTIQVERGSYNDTATGAFYITNTNTTSDRSSASSTQKLAGFDASRSSSIYGSSTTVQAPATQMYLYFYVGNFTQTALENTAGLNAELFNDKADVDLSNAVSNASVTAKETIVGWGTPDYSAGVAFSSGVDYQAPSDGFVIASGWTNTSTNSSFYLNGTRMAAFIANASALLPGMVYCPVRKGDTINITFTQGTYTMNFYPLKGV